MRQKDPLSRPGKVSPAGVALVALTPAPAVGLNQGEPPSKDYGLEYGLHRTTD